MRSHPVSATIQYPRSDMSERLNLETRMLREAQEAPQVVVHLLESNAPLCRELGERLRASPPPFAVTCARGSSDNAATFVKYLLEIHSGLVTASVGPSVTSVYEARPRMRDALFLAVSQSGRSPDILNLAQAGRDDGALTVALVNDTTSPLASTCEVVLPLHAGPEKSVAATKSFIAALVAGSGASGCPRYTAELARQGFHDRLVGRASGSVRSEQPVRRRTRCGLCRCAGSRAQAQGDIRRSCGGDERRRTDARPLDACRRSLPDPGAQPAG